MIDGRPGEACGVFGVYAPGQPISTLILFGLFALQHRGQESAGISTSDGRALTTYKDMGLVAQVFDEHALATLDGHMGIGHVRYSTTGSNRWENAQPVDRRVGEDWIALGHNGNLTNTSALAARFPGRGATTDSEVMSEVIASAMESGCGLVESMVEVLPTFAGAFTLVAMDLNSLIGVRDPNGFRPLCIGRLPEGDGWVLASETAALDILGARLVREVEAGEMVVIDADGLRSLRPFAKIDPRLCLFEFVYFARPDSTLGGASVFAARRRMGRCLATEHPAMADVVVPVPESGIPAAQGFAEVSGIPYADGLVKNRYIGRTFIEPTQLMRDRGVRIKLNPIPATFADRRVVLVDDSIVRGSTTRQLVQMVREAGAAEVHLRISSPPYRWPCFYGMDTSDKSTLIAARMTTDEVCRHLGADSLGHLSLGGLLDSTEFAGNGFCTACLSGIYPTPIDHNAGKSVLEGVGTG
jgi:amidophosphoribosyltransferase